MSTICTQPNVNPTTPIMSTFPSFCQCQKTTQGKDVDYTLVGDLSSKLNSQVVSLDVHSKGTKQKAKH
jgi:phosphoribosylpyrophosphate synthetase